MAKLTKAARKKISLKNLAKAHRANRAKAKPKRKRKANPTYPTRRQWSTKAPVAKKRRPAAKRKPAKRVYTKPKPKRTKANSVKRRAPTMAKKKRKTYHAKPVRRRRNPRGAFGGALGRLNPNVILKVVAGNVAGAVVVRTVPQMILGDRNVGIFGHVANIVTGLVGAGIVSQMDRDTALGFATGALGAYISRITQDASEMVGGVVGVSGMGDRMFGMGEYVPRQYRTEWARGLPRTAEMARDAQLPSAAAEVVEEADETMQGFSRRMVS